MTKKIFISYRRADTAWAAVCLREGLTRRLDVDVFLDFKTLFPGVNFVDAINGSIDACDILIAVIGPQWFLAKHDDGRRRIDDPNDWVRMEIARALEQGKTVIPVTCDEAMMPTESWFPEPLKPLADLQALELSSKAYDPVIEGFADVLKTRYAFVPRSADQPLRDPGPVPEPEEGETRDPRTLFFMGRETFDHGDYRKAEKEFAEAAVRLRDELGYDDIVTLRAQRWLATALEHQGRLEEASSLIATITPIMSGQSDFDERELAASLVTKAQILSSQGLSEEAEAILRSVLSTDKRVSGAEHPDTLTTRAEIAGALLDQGRAAEAEAAWRDLLPVRERVSGAEHPDTLTTRSLIASALLDQGRAAEAEAAWRDLLPVEERVKGAEHPHTLASRSRLAQAGLAQGRAEEASAELAEVAEIAARVMAETHPNLGYIAFLRAQTADALGDRAAADGFIAAAEANWGDRLTPEHPYRREMAAYLAGRPEAG